MATIERIHKEKKEKGKKKGGMESAVASTEKIRSWVSYHYRMSV